MQSEILPRAVERLHLEDLEQRRRVRRLVDGGDWACSNGDVESLAHVARQLIADAPRAIQFDLVAVAELASVDFLVASSRWSELSGRLRS